jgi:hypothetical protein
MTRRRLAAVLLVPAAVLLPGRLPGRDETPDPARLPPASAKKVDFRTDVYPLLAERCFPCHQGADAKSGFRLDIRAEILGETNGTPLAVPGKSESSRLIQLVAGQDKDKVMPPKKADRLTSEQVGLLRAWIDQGLTWDDDLLPPPAAETKHWAFQPIRRPAVPAVQNRDWVRTPVDAFIAAGHEARGLAPAPEASRHALSRRLALDLTGLPPAVGEVEAALSDKSPDAYERLVERVLASPHYGERWGRHWLDVARWAESEGYEDNRFRPDAWRYRDYVVRAFNDDKPFDQFIRQQVAGDELLPFSDENLIATGFLAAARYSGNEEDKAIQRNDVLVDVTNATASAFLGLTLACAQCHNHKFDPLAQRDYYRFHGFFVQGQLVNLVLKDPELWRQYRAARDAAPKPAFFGPAEQLRTTLLDEARAKLRDAAVKKLAPEARAALDTPADRRTAEQQTLAQQAEAGLWFTDAEAEKALSDDDRRLAEALKKKLAPVEKALPQKPQTFGFFAPGSSPTPVDVIPWESTYSLPYEPQTLSKTRPRLLVRGDVLRPGPELDIGWPAVFGPTPPEVGGRRPRTALADWLTAPTNPLTARVWANRVWHYHFGRGLAATPGDFGVKGEPPTHPQLLDYLASELIASGWSTKHLHRLIVRSATYRQAARPDPASAKADPDNLYLTRWQPRRLESEAIRDVVLAVSGELDRTAGGPSVPLAPRKPYTDDPVDEAGTVLCRSLYLRLQRDGLPPMHALFDGPRATESCARRHVSTVALQPLFLLNSPFMVSRAKAFAARVASQAGDDIERQVDMAFRLALGRLPTCEEREAVRPLLTEGEAKAPAKLVRVCHLLLNLNEFIYLD